MRHARSYESFSTCQSLLGGSANTAFNDTGWDVPPSTKVRVAQRMHLVPKTYFSTHDAQRQCVGMIKDFKDLSLSCEKVRVAVEEAVTIFGPDGFKLQAELREVTTHLSNGFIAAAESTSDFMKILEASCKRAAFVEPEYRKAYKHVIKAQEKFTYAESHGASQTKIANLSRDLERKKVSCEVVKRTYDEETLALALQLCHGFAQQISFNSSSISESFRLVTDLPHDLDASPFPDHNGIHRDYNECAEEPHYFEPDDVYSQANMFTKPLDSVPDEEGEISSILEDIAHCQGYSNPHVEPCDPRVEVPTRISRATCPLYSGNLQHDRTPLDQASSVYLQLDPAGEDTQSDGGVWK